LPVAYTSHTKRLWANFATLILEAAYEATLCAAVVNTKNTGNNTVYLTLLGGGAFGNEEQWIGQAIRRAIAIYANANLIVAIVSYGSSKPLVQQLINEFHGA
jgi:hypothetical protein